jgi:hypothetical protein
MIYAIKCNKCGHWQILHTQDFKEAKPKCNKCEVTISCYGKRTGAKVDWQEFNLGQDAVLFCMDKNNLGNTFFN